MKKLVCLALILALVLGLSAVADAASVTYDLYDNDGELLVKEATLKKVSAETKTSGGNVQYYCLSADNGDDRYLYEEDGNVFVDASSDECDYVLTKHDKKDVVKMLIMVDEADTYYDYAGTPFTDIGNNCGQYKRPSKYSSKTKFYTYTTGGKTVHLAKADNTPDEGVNLMVNGQLVICDYIGKLSEELTPHTWRYNTDAMTAECANCGATAKMYKKTTDVPAGETYEKVGGHILVINGTDTVAAAKTAAAAATTASTASTAAAATTASPVVTAAKTFDAGIAMYVGMSLLAVTGSAVVIGKKKEF